MSTPLVGTHVDTIIATALRHGWDADRIGQHVDFSCGPLIAPFRVDIDETGVITAVSRPAELLAAHGYCDDASWLRMGPPVYERRRPDHLIDWGRSAEPPAPVHNDDGLALMLAILAIIVSVAVVAVIVAAAVCG